MGTQTLSWDSRIDRYTGTQMDGTYVEIDGTAFAEAREQRERDGMSAEQALNETLDPDGWDQDMAGYIPATEHLAHH